MIILDIRVRGIELGQLVDKTTRERLEKVEEHNGLGDLEKLRIASNILESYLEKDIGVERLIRLARVELEERHIIIRYASRIDNYAECKAPEGSPDRMHAEILLEKNIGHYNRLLRLNNARRDMIERRL